MTLKESAFENMEGNGENEGNKPFLLVLAYQRQNSSLICICLEIGLYDNVQSQFKKDQDYAKLQGQGLDWFSRSGLILRTYQEPAGDLTTCTNTRVLTHSHTMTPFDAPGKQFFLKHCGKRRNCS